MHELLLSLPRLPHFEDDPALRLCAGGMEHQTSRRAFPAFLVESQPFGHRVVLFAADALELLAPTLHNRKQQLVIYKSRSDNA